MPNNDGPGKLDGEGTGGIEGTTALLVLTMLKVGCRLSCLVTSWCDDFGLVDKSLFNSARDLSPFSATVRLLLALECSDLWCLFEDDELCDFLFGCSERMSPFWCAVALLDECFDE